MKKTFLVSLAVFFLICTALTGFAAPNGAPVFSVKDVANDVINVAGKTNNNEMVTLIVLNPGYDEEDIDFSDSAAMEAAVQYIGSKWASKKSYSFDIPMNGTAGGAYTVLVTSGSDKYVAEDGEPVTFEFYFLGEKEDIIEEINDEDDFNLLKGLVDEAYTLYSFGTDPLYKDGDISKITKSVEYFKAEEDGFEVVPEDFAEVLKISSLIGAYNAGKTNLLVEDDYLKYTDSSYLNVEENEAYEDYIDDINSDGLEKLHEALIESEVSYNTTEEIVTYFRELVAYYGIAYNVKAGYGHIDRYFEKYSDIYDEYGFDIDDLKSRNKSSVYKKLMEKDTDNMEELKKEFNKLVAASNESKKSSGGGSSSSYSPAPVTTPADTNYIVPSAFFIDLASVPWAEEEILALADKGIVNGVGNNNFAPNATVTRAEFLKMLLSALELSDGSTEVAFTDVTDGWSVPYVAAAVKHGVTSGVSETEFAPNASVTREQSATFICRALNAKGIVLEADVNVFADDSEISDWAKEGVNCLKKAGAVTGSGDGTFKPKNNLTRAEAAQMIYNILNIK